MTEKVLEFNTHYKKRWYDNHSKLMHAIHMLKPLKGKALDEIVIELKNIICRHDTDLIDRYFMAFPLKPFKRRWYDKDPYLWIVINSLRFADQDTLEDVIEFISNRYSVTSG